MGKAVIPAITKIPRDIEKSFEVKIATCESLSTQNRDQPLFNAFSIAKIIFNNLDCKTKWKNEFIGPLNFTFKTDNSFKCFK
jgi:hypothetical protein